MNATAVLGWGNMSDGQLGFGGIEDEQIYNPREISHLAGKRIMEISSSFSHSLFIAEDGLLYSCGNNDYHQLGHDKPRKRPERIDTLETQIITQVCCGPRHSMALTHQGQVFSWGSNENKQLGRVTSALTSSPKLIRLPNTGIAIVQICCGYNHSLALADNGNLFTWGSNEFGQLGVASLRDNARCVEPQLVSSLSGLAISQIASGANHNLVLTVSGALFGWGDNKFGQLGVGDQRSRSTPELCKTLRTQAVKFVCCGDNHSAVLTHNGGVFTFGAGMFGQLGHGNTNSESNPKKVFEFMGFEVSMIACGRNHTLAYVKSKDKLYAFGLGSNGQLGLGSRSNFHIPTFVSTPSIGRGSIVRSIHAGGDQTFVVLSNDLKLFPQKDYRELIHSKQISTITFDLVDCINSCAIVTDELERKIKKVFSSFSCINGSFLRINNEHYSCSSFNHGVDVVASRQAFDGIYKSRCKLARDLVDATVEKFLLNELPSKFIDVEMLRFFVVMPTSHYFTNPELYAYSMLLPMLRSIIQLDKNLAKVLDSWWKDLGADYLVHFVKSLKSVITYILGKKGELTQGQIVLNRHVLYSSLEVLKKLHQIGDSCHPPLEYNIFYIDTIHDLVSLDLDYLIWISKSTSRSFIGNIDNEMTPLDFYGETQPFCNYPFIFDGQSKTIVLRVDAMIQMREAVDEAQRRNIASLFLPIDPINPCLVLMVTRNNIVPDTISQLTKHEDLDFKKPMKVIFLGEEAMDAGGVKKEFFMLLLKDLLDPKYGMFQYYEESRLLWLNPDTFELHTMYHLVGVICGLAIYNNNIISMNLPLVLFKKLLKKDVSLDDMKELQPTIGKSLQDLLDYPGDDVEDVFGLSFEMTREIYGKFVTIPLVPGGSEKLVNRENRAHYVEVYINYIFNESVFTQFEAFREGFLKVCGGRVLELFQPKELQAMVVGNENYDWDELEKNTTYKEYTKDDLPIKMFWEVFRELSLEEKKKFLLFLTGCDRIPIHGMKAIPLVIQAVSSSEEFLPVAHTCSNILDLPRYTSKETLKTKLLHAIEHTQGFGLV